MVCQIVFLNDTGQLEELKRYEIDWAIVGYGLLQEVRDGVGRSHGEDNIFAKEVEEMHAQGILNQAKNLRVAGMEVLEKEWTKLRAIADEVD